MATQTHTCVSPLSVLIQLILVLFVTVGYSTHTAIEEVFRPPPKEKILIFGVCLFERLSSPKHTLLDSLYRYMSERAFLSE